MNIEWSEIEKILNGTASDEEIVQFDLWLAENPEKKEYFEKIHHYFSDTESAVKENIVERKSRHSADNIVRSSQTKRFVRRSLLSGGVAAALVILSLVLYYDDTQTTVPEPILLTESRVKITKDSGEEIKIETLNVENIKLDSAKKELLYNEKANIAEVIEYHTIVIPKETDYNLTLSDGTKIKLNAGSQLRYPSHFREGEPRRVYLSGEGYFDVEHSDKDQFVVNVENMNVVVYGTKFNINSYDNNIETVLKEGSVAIMINGRETMLKPNEMASVQKLGDKVIISSIDADDYLSWTKGFFAFDNRRLDDIVKALNRWYGSSIEFENDIVKEETFSCHVEKINTLDDFLKALVNTGRVKYRRVGDKYILR